MLALLAALFAIAIPVDPALTDAAGTAVAATAREHPRLNESDVAISLIDLTDADSPRRGDVNGDVAFYPASVIKLFFLADAFAEEKEKVPDMERALEAMIVESDNDAAAYVVDIVSGTQAGEELRGRALEWFIEKRSAINTRFAARGLAVRAAMKPWSFGPYGRERQLLGSERERRNRVTANTTASLLASIVRKEWRGSEAMLALLHRPLDDPRPDENQVAEFIGEALPPGSTLWSKAGWTSEVRHDAAYVELPDGRRLVIVIFTRGAGDDVGLIPAATRHLLAALSAER